MRLHLTRGRRRNRRTTSTIWTAGAAAICRQRRPRCVAGPQTRPTTEPRGMHACTRAEGGSGEGGRHRLVQTHHSGRPTPPGTSQAFDHHTPDKARCGTRAREQLRALSQLSAPPVPTRRDLPALSARERLRDAVARAAPAQRIDGRRAQDGATAQTAGRGQADGRGTAAWATALIVFSGPGHDADLAARLRARGVAVTVVDTKVGGAGHDVRRPSVGQRLITRVRRGDYDMVFAAPPCESFSVAHRPQLCARGGNARGCATRRPSGRRTCASTTSSPSGRRG
jgi:hypothetical protein